MVVLEVVLEIMVGMLGNICRKFWAGSADTECWGGAKWVVAGLGNNSGPAGAEESLHNWLGGKSGAQLLKSWPEGQIQGSIVVLQNCLNIWPSSESPT